MSSVVNQDLKQRWPRNYAIVSGNLGYSLMKSGNLKDVEALLTESLNLSFKNKNEDDAVNLLINLGEYYLIQKDTSKSREF